MSLRLSTSSNPIGLRLGEHVSYRRKCVVDYDENDNKRVIFDAPASAPLSCVVIGSIKKAVGKYYPGGKPVMFTMGGYDDYDPPRLEVDHYVWLYECRKTIDGKPFFVHPDDIVLE